MPEVWLDRVVLGDRFRVCVCGQDEDLRAWIVEELRLMTWIAEVELTTFSTIEETPSQLDLLIVCADGLTTSELECVAQRRRSSPVIGVGSTHIAADRTFGPKLTSRELKQAIRELVFAPAVSASSQA